MLIVFLLTLLLQTQASTDRDYTSLSSSTLQTLSSSLLTTSPLEALSVLDVLLERNDVDKKDVVCQRAAVKERLGHSRGAVTEWKECVTLGGDKQEADLHISKIYLKEANFDDALIFAQSYASTSKAEGQALIKTVKSTKSKVESGRKALEKSNYQRCVDFSSEAIEISPNSLDLRILRSTCYLYLSDFEMGVGDLSRALSLGSSSLSPSYLIRHSLLSLLYTPPPSSHLLTPIKTCLHSDPDSKVCLKVHKELKKVEREWKKVQNFLEGDDWRKAANVLIGEEGMRGKEAKGLLGIVKGLIDSYKKKEGIFPDEEFVEKYPSPFIRQLISSTCKCFLKLSNPSNPNLATIKKSSTYCLEARKLDLENEDVWAMVGEGEEAIISEDFERAVRVLNAAFEKEREVGIRDRLVRAQKLLKVSKQKDYYKILGVKRDADKATIKKAYRKATLKAHPDKGGSEEKMAEVNQAWEVLGDEELKARYDNGEDPMDPTQQHGGGGNPFQHHAGGQMFQQFFHQQQGGGFPGGGFGGQQFNFKFG